VDQGGVMLRLRSGHQGQKLDNVEWTEQGIVMVSTREIRTFAYVAAQVDLAQRP
jgi:hypothetical protein